MRGEASCNAFKSTLWKLEIPILGQKKKKKKEKEWAKSASSNNSIMEEEDPFSFLTISLFLLSSSHKPH